LALTEGPKYSVEQIKFSGDGKEKLKNYLSQELSNVEGERGRLLDKCKLWAQQANSRRPRKNIGPKDANIDMPLTRQRMMQNSARLLNPIFQQDALFIAKPRNPVVEDLARAVEKMVDYVSDGIDYRTICDEWVEQFQTFPFGVIKTPFIYETERIKKWVEIADFEEANLRKLDGQKVSRKLANGEEKFFVEVDEEVPVREGVYPEIIPFEDFIVPMSAADIRTADWVIHRSWPTKPMIKDRIRSGMYNKTDDGVSVLEAIAEPNADRERLLQLAGEKGRDLELDDGAKQYEICEAYLKWEVEKDAEPIEIIVTFERSSMVILRAVYNFYHSYKRPFVAHEYKKVQGSIFGIPLTFILEPLHVARSASVCQRLDTASRSNEVIVAIPPGSGDSIKPIDKDIWGVGFVEADIQKGELQDIKLTQGFTQLPELESQLEREADKLSALSDYSFGQEQIDRPTATGQVQIIEESKQPQYMMLERFRASLAEVCKHVLARLRQFYPEGLQFYAMQEDPQGVQMIEEFFKWPEQAIEKDVIIETKVSSASMSKSLRKQEIVALLDKLNEYYGQLMQLSMVATDPMNPSAPIAATLMNGLYTVMNDMLTEFEVGKKDQLNPQLIDVVQVMQNVKAQMDQLMQQINQLGAQNQQLQMANAELQSVVAGGPPVDGGAGQAPGPQGPPQMAPGPQIPGGQPPA
jgi:hypothetical protein